VHLPLSKETRRKQLFSRYWQNDLDPVFTDVVSSLSGLSRR